jgi:S-adenosylmethionine:tRNA ribosyltransferase-isomerase
MKLSDFDYDLPPELIAQHPLAERRASRLLHLDAKKRVIRDQRFDDLAALLRPGDLVVVNDTKVMKARLLGVKQSGGRCEVLVERVLDERRVLAQVNASHAPLPGTKLFLEGLKVEVVSRHGEFFELEFGEDALAALDKHGRVPLPPYIEREVSGLDESRYQTVYAKHRGAVAAPTAGLHFDEALFEELRRQSIAVAYLTLHVGAGTFQPVRSEDISLHRMHSERFDIPQATIEAIGTARACGGRVVAVGTTSLRALEAAAQSGTMKPGEGETTLFVVPGFTFRVVDVLLTNFHLPRSTLFILVAAFAGLENVRRAYHYAIDQRYRFFSYGDAMLIERA